MSPDDPRHGRYAGAVAHWLENRESPCPACYRAETRYRKQRKLDLLGGNPRLVPSIGTVRRIQALQAIGWTGPRIATEAGVSLNSMRSIQYHEATVVRSVTAAKISAAYERLCMTHPEGHYANRARSIAARRGWAPPNAWLDLDDPTETPDPGYRELKTRPVAQTVEEWDHLRSLGVSIDQAARQLGVTVGAIERAVERMGEVA